MRGTFFLIINFHIHEIEGLQMIHTNYWVHTLLIMYQKFNKPNANMLSAILLKF